MGYKIDVIWAGCDISDVLATVTCDEWSDVKGMRSILKLAASGSMDDGFQPKLALRIHDLNGKEIAIIDQRNGWQLPDIHTRDQIRNTPLSDEDRARLSKLGGIQQAALSYRARKSPGPARIAANSVFSVWGAGSLFVCFAPPLPVWMGLTLLALTPIAAFVTFHRMPYRTYEEEVLGRLTSYNPSNFAAYSDLQRDVDTHGVRAERIAAWIAVETEHILRQASMSVGNSEASQDNSSERLLERKYAFVTKVL